MMKSTRHAYSSPDLLIHLMDETAGDTCWCKTHVKAILFSKFPEGFLRKSVIPKLEKRGISVSKIVYPKDARSVNEIVDVALFMHEMAGHGEEKQVRFFANRHKVPIFFLSRKSSTWEGKLPPILPEFGPEESDSTDDTIDESFSVECPEKVACSDDKFYSVNCDQLPALTEAPHSLDNSNKTETDENQEDAMVKKPRKSSSARVNNKLSDKDLESVCRIIMTERNAGKSYDEFFNEVRKFWLITDGPQSPVMLQKFAGNTSRSPRCPSWFKKWYNSKIKVRPTEPAKKASIQRKEKVVETPKKVKEPRSPEPRSPEPKHDDAELARMYAEENEILKKRVASLEAETKKEFTSGHGRINEFKSRIEEVVASCRLLVDISAMDAKESLRIIEKFLKNHNENG